MSEPKSIHDSSYRIEPENPAPDLSDHELEAQVGAGPLWALLHRRTENARRALRIMSLTHPQRPAVILLIEEREKEARQKTEAARHAELIEKTGEAVVRAVGRGPGIHWCYWVLLVLALGTFYLTVLQVWPWLKLWD